MHSLENENIKIWIKPKGAELKSLTLKSRSLEYIWNADPDFWGKSSPVLFPIVGGLKDNTYSFDGKTYEMGRHGFARDMVFAVDEKKENQIAFVLKSSSETLAIYPFEFEFRVIYSLEGYCLTVNYEVKNAGNKDMYFSVGAHPAFKVPIDEELSYKDYSINFNKPEKAERWLLTQAGLLSGSTELLDNELSILPLSKDLFRRDALVFKGLKSDSLKLSAKHSQRFIKFGFKGFPYFGIWAAPEANFVCLEPWCGVADSVSHNQELTTKEGINKLKPQATFERSWSVEVS